MAAVSSGGSGYLSPPTATLTSESIQATASATLNGTSPSPLSSVISITNAGAGYTSPPTVTFTGGGKATTVATGVATINAAGQVTGITDTGLLR